MHDHFETFRAQAASLRDGEGLPRFVEQEFRDFLQCGWLAGNVSWVARSVPELDQAAVDAVTQWRYEPTLLKGEPVDVELKVTINFTLS